MKELYRAIGGLWEGLHFPCHGVADEIIRAGPLLLIVSHPEDNESLCGLLWLIIRGLLSSGDYPSRIGVVRHNGGLFEIITILLRGD